MGEQREEGMGAVGSRSRAGRRPKPATTALGALIEERLAATGISQAELVRRLGVSRATAWRILHGRVGFSRQISLPAVCSALGMDEAETAVFLSTHGVGIPTDGVAIGPQAGQEETAASQLWTFLDERRRHARLSWSELARKLNVRPSTITRLLRGEIKRTHSINAEQVAAALRLDTMARRRFLALALEAGLFALQPVPAQTAALLRFRPLERTVGASLDEIEGEVIELRARRNRGEVEPVHVRARQLFDHLFDYHCRDSALVRSPELARAKLRVAFEYCEAQAAALGWYERAPRMIETLNRMQAEVLQHFPFPPVQFASEYGHLVNLRAPLYREAANGMADKGDPARREKSYQEAIWELTWALERIVPHLAELSLRVELLRNRAHLHLMRADTNRWEADLSAAERVAANMPGGEGDAFRGLVTYSWGEGYQHLAALPHLAAQQRKRYLTTALDQLAAGQVVFQRRPNWEGYDLLAKIAEAECIAWEDRAEAVARARRLRAISQRIYPSLVRKIDRVLARRP